MGMNRFATAIMAFIGLFALTACEPEVGSKEWCEDIKAKGVDNVTANEATDYAKNCVF